MYDSNSSANEADESSIGSNQESEKSILINKDDKVFEVVNQSNKNDELKNIAIIKLEIERYKKLYDDEVKKRNLSNSPSSLHVESVKPSTKVFDNNSVTALKNLQKEVNGALAQSRESHKLLKEKCHNFESLLNTLIDIEPKIRSSGSHRNGSM